MLKTYLISYDLTGGKSSLAYSKLIKSITSVSYWAKPLESVFIIKSDFMASKIASVLRQSVGPNDKLFVVELNRDWAGLNLPINVINWLRANI